MMASRVSVLSASGSARTARCGYERVDTSGPIVRQTPFVAVELNLVERISVAGPGPDDDAGEHEGSSRTSGAWLRPELLRVGLRPAFFSASTIVWATAIPYMFATAFGSPPLLKRFMIER